MINYNYNTENFIIYQFKNLFIIWNGSGKPSCGIVMQE